MKNHHRQSKTCFDQDGHTTLRNKNRIIGVVLDTKLTSRSINVNWSPSFFICKKLEVQQESRSPARHVGLIDAGMPLSFITESADDLCRRPIGICNLSVRSDTFSGEMETNYPSSR